ncbi:MAG: aldehyde ferredoxin oxidoreductase family protein [bacterium]
MATRYGGYTGEMLDVDLTSGTVERYDVTDRDRERFLGGKALAAKILFDELEPGADPLGEDNVIVINTGPLTGSGAPCTSRFNVAAKSPLTGALCTSNCGGGFGIHLKRAGFDGIIIRGKAASPSLIEIEDGTARIADASHLWGMNTEETQARLGDGRGKAVIGPAGENLVLFASIISGERAAGRTGAGAVMGAKNLKAITAKGTGKIPVARPDEFRKTVKKWVKILKEHPTTGGSLPRFGTAGFLNRVSVCHTLPTRNFSSGTFEHAEEISGEALAEKHLVKNIGCASCPIRCGRGVELGGKLVKGPEFETIGMFGSNIGNRDLAAICEWNRVMDLMGFDTISAGATIAFAMELNSKGLWKNGLEFGKTDGMARLLDDVAHRRGIGGEIADGVRRLSERYGGEDFAIHVKGLEMAAYEPRGSVGMGIGYATANRGACHLDSGYLVFLERIGPINVDPYATAPKPALAVMQQNILDAISASGCCLFTSYASIPAAAHGIKPYGTLAKLISASLGSSHHLLDHAGALPYSLLSFHAAGMLPHTLAVSNLTGMNVGIGDFMAVGERSFNMGRLFNVREGIARESDALPRRLTHELQIPGDTRTRVRLDEMLKKYYRIRGWDKRGVPTRRRLRKLGMEDCARVTVQPSEALKEECRMMNIQCRSKTGL